MRSDFSAAFEHILTPTKEMAFIPEDPKDVIPSLRQLNAGSVIFRLPVELLCHIFLLAVQPKEAFILSFIRRNCFQIGQVCHRWREIALGYPLLWTSIKKTNEQTRTELVRRSQSAPLTLEAHVNHDINIVTLVPAELHRIRVLSCTGSGPEFQSFVENISIAPAPILERLEFKSRTRIPAFLFKGEAPRLRELVLSGTTGIQWRSPLFNNLTSFIGENVEFREPSSESDVYEMFNAFASTIEDINLLRYLYAPLPSRYSTDTPAAPFEQVALPKLTSFKIGADIIVCSYLLSHIIPAQPVNLKLILDVGKIQQLDTLLPWIARNMQLQLDRDPRGFTSIHFSGDSRAQLGVVIESSGQTVDLGFEIDLNSVEQVLPGADSLADDIEAALYSALPLRQIKNFSLQCRSQFSDRWIEHFGRMKELECAQLSGSISMFFLALIDGPRLRDPGTAEGGGLGEILLPKLREVTMNNFDFGALVEEDEFQLLRISTLITETLAYRKKIGFPLEKLTIRNSQRVSESLLQKWQEDVGCVDWDNKGSEMPPVMPRLFRNPPHYRYLYHQ